METLEGFPNLPATVRAEQARRLPTRLTSPLEIQLGAAHE